jgi:mRNA-degrading endonuclease RelE of RelBE toxin-antitoxin system
MRLDYSPRFLRSYAKSPSRIQKLLPKASGSLASRSSPPLAKAKKYDEARNIWQARVDGGWRFYFQIRGDTYYLLNITPHPK